MLLNKDPSPSSSSLVSESMEDTSSPTTKDLLSKEVQYPIQKVKIFRKALLDNFHREIINCIDSTEFDIKKIRIKIYSSIF